MGMISDIGWKEGDILRIGMDDSKLTVRGKSNPLVQLAKVGKSLS